MPNFSKFSSIICADKQFFYFASRNLRFSYHINTYGKIRNASAWQRIKDRFRGYRAAFRKRQWFDSIYDHGMPNYVERIKKQKDGMIIL